MTDHDIFNGVLAEPKAPSSLHARRLIAPLKIGRNDQCPCGSGVKFKKCHGDCETPAAIIAACHQKGNNVVTNVLMWLENHPLEEQ